MMLSSGSRATIVIIAYLGIFVNNAYVLSERNTCNFGLFERDLLGFLADFEFEALFLAGNISNDDLEASFGLARDGNDRVRIEVATDNFAAD